MRSPPLQVSVGRRGGGNRLSRPRTRWEAPLAKSWGETLFAAAGHDPKKLVGQLGYLGSLVAQPARLVARPPSLRLVPRAPLSCFLCVSFSF